MLCHPPAHPLFHSLHECVNQHKWSHEPTKGHWWPPSIQTVDYLCLFPSSYARNSYSHITEFSLLPHHCVFKSLRSHCKKPSDIEVSRWERSKESGLKVSTSLRFQEGNPHADSLHCFLAITVVPAKFVVWPFHKIYQRKNYLAPGHSEMGKVTKYMQLKNKQST